MPSRLDCEEDSFVAEHEATRLDEPSSNPAAEQPDTLPAVSAGAYAALTHGGRDRSRGSIPSAPQRLASLTAKALHARHDPGIIGAMSRRSLSGWRAASAVGVGVAWLAVVLASYDRPSAQAPALAAPAQPPPAEVDVADRLPGTWLREHVDKGMRSRRLLHLEPGGTFSEQVRIVSATGEASRHEHAGTWFYDGTNLKRKYTVMNGRPPSRLNLPFATFEIRFESRDRFEGTDHIHRNTVRYRRVPRETEL